MERTQCGYDAGTVRDGAAMGEICDARCPAHSGGNVWNAVIRRRDATNMMARHQNGCSEGIAEAQSATEPFSNSVQWIFAGTGASRDGNGAVVFGQQPTSTGLPSIMGISLQADQYPIS